MIRNSYFRGALTSKPYAFTVRSWELDYINTIDILDSINSKIQVSIKDNDIKRILPLINSEINDDWISDKIRFSYDSLRNQRLIIPFIKYKKKLIKISWKKILEFFKFLKIYLSNKNNIYNFIGINGLYNDIESIFLLKTFINLNKSNIVLDNFFINGKNCDLRSNYLIIKKLNNLFLNDSTILLIVGVNLRLEYPILNIKIRKLVLENNLKVFYIGNNINLNYKYIHISNNYKNFYKFLEGKHWLCNFFLKKYSYIMLPANLFNNLNIKKYDKYISNFYFLVNNSSNINSAEVGFINEKRNIIKKNQYNLLYFLNTDFDLKTKGFKIYQGHHGLNFLKNFDIIIPSSTFFEKNSTYINIEGRLQKTKTAVYTFSNMKNDIQILFILCKVFSFELSFDKVSMISEYIYKRYINSKFLEHDIKYKKKKKIYKNKNNIFFSIMDNYYISDIFSSSSKIMGLCSQRIIRKKLFLN
jgi:NADH-quinone oxidoreductase subunit G